jgi:hypothetical protein
LREFGTYVGASLKNQATLAQREDPLNKRKESKIPEVELPLKSEEDILPLALIIKGRKLHLKGCLKFFQNIAIK